MPKSLKKTFMRFTPAEAEAITDVSGFVQRAWRRRGHLPQSLGGHARFELFDLAQLLTLRLFSDAGLGLEAAKEWAPELPATIIAHALREPGAIEGDVSATSMIGAGTIASEFSRVLCGGPLVFWADGSSEVIGRTDGAIAKASSNKTFGAVRVFPLESIGRELARRAGRALVHIEMIDR